MATWTEADLTALSNAIAQGAQSVSFSDGKRVVYRSLADMMALRDQMRKDLGLEPAGPVRKVMAHSKGVSPSRHGGRYDFTR